VNAVTNSPEDPRFVALVDVIRRSGAAEFQIRYDDEQDPIVWVAVVGHKMHNGRPRTVGKVNHYEAAGAMSPLAACYRLAEILFDGGECAHCHRPTGISDDWTAEMPHAAHICWYIYDPENETFRRSCEGET
jgi:hypothetical protein